MLFNLSNMRCKKLHWMTESVWRWHIVFTDRMSALQPKYSQLTNYTPYKTTAANRRSACSNIHMPSDRL